MLWPHGLKVQGALAITALFFSLLTLPKREYRIINMYPFLLLLFCLSPLYLSVVWSHDLNRTSYELLKISPGILGCLALSQLLQRPAQLQKVLTLTTVTASVTVMFGVILIVMYGSLRGTYRGVGELQGISGILASYVQLFVPIGICLIITSHNIIMRIIVFFLTQCCLVILIYSSTRAALLGLVVSLVALSFGVIGIHRYVFRYCMVFIMLIPLTLLAVRFPPNHIIKEELEHRVEKTIEIEKNKTGVSQVTQESGRLKTWKRALQIYIDNPITGVGFEAFSRKYWYTNPHNVIFDCILGAGVAGFIGIVTIFVCSGFGYIHGIRVLRYRDPSLALYAAGLGSALVGVVVYGMLWQILWHPFFYLDV